MNITKRENGIYMAELRVPKDVRHIIGKTRLTRSLKTKDKRIAQQEAGAVLAKWDRQIRLAREEPDAVLEEMAIARARLDREREDPSIKHDEWGLPAYGSSDRGDGLGRSRLASKPSAKSG